MAKSGARGGLLRARQDATKAKAKASSSDPAPGPSAWDLSGAPDGLVLEFAKCMELAWRGLPGVRDVACAPDLKSVDAVGDAMDPGTKVRIENLVFQSPKFRKMHLEVAWGLGGLEVAHVVVYPYACVGAPIYAADVVSFNGRVTLCIADTCPVVADLTLPQSLVEAGRELRTQMMARAPSIEPRPVPEWGTAILSKENMVCVGPPKEDGAAQKQAAAFCEYALLLFDTYAAFVEATAIGENENDHDDANATYGGCTAKRHAQHVLFCEKQLENDKTRKALERSMGGPRTERYMTEVLFDVTAGTPTEPR